MEHSIETINQILHNNGVSKQSRIKLLVDLLKGEDSITDMNLKNKLMPFIESLKLGKNQDDIQTIFMMLGEKVLKQSLDQYYTPSTIGNFIAKCCESDNEYVSVLEPACGTGDLVTSINSDFTEFRDISSDVCELLQLNLELRGLNNTKYNIFNVNSLSYNSENKFTYVVSNPPFGTKTIEENKDILKKFEIAKGKKKEQLGKLFIEYGLQQLLPNGILYIIIPTGYLTNKGDINMRKLLFMKYRIVAIIELPQNTFKRSGTGVDTALLIAENSETEDDYEIFIAHPEVIGINTKNKNTPPLYVVDTNGKTTDIVNNDFDKILDEFGSFCSKNNIKNLHKNINEHSYTSVKKSTLVADGMTLAVKQYLNNYLDVVNNIKSSPYFTLEGKIDENINKKKTDMDTEYLYIDISEINNSDYLTKNWMKGYQLPGRATYEVKENDIVLSKLKGTPSFTMIFDDCDSLILTNGVFILRIADEKYRLALFRFMFDARFVLQFNNLAGGSIMACVNDYDLRNKIYIPLYSDDELTEVNELLSCVRKAHKIKNKFTHY